MKSIYLSGIRYIVLLLVVLSLHVHADPTDSLQITIPHLKNAHDSPFLIKDTVHNRVLLNRIRQIKSKLDIYTTPYSGPASVLGYRGLGLESSNAHDPTILYTFNGTMAICPSAVSSMLQGFNDFNSDTEHLIAKIGRLGNLTTINNGKEILFTSCIPDELQKTQTRYGFIVLEIVTDTFTIDFSMLENQIMYYPRVDTLPKFNDIQIIRAREMSSSQYAFKISAPEGITQISKVDLSHTNYRFYQQSVDSVLLQSIPELDTFSTQMGSLSFSDAAFFSPDIHSYSFLIKTADLGVVYFLPVSWYIGAIDRVSFFWVYSSDSVFDIKALKEFENQSTSIRPVMHTATIKQYSKYRITNLLGKAVQSPSPSMLSKQPGFYIKNSSNTGKAEPFLIVK